MLNIYYARESTDKEKFIFENITPGSFVIVPDQYTLEAERRAFRHMKVKGLPDIEILGFSRLGDKVLNATGRDGRVLIDKYGRQMLLTGIILRQKENLEIYKGFEEKNSFVEMVNNFISEVKQHGMNCEGLEAVAEGLDESSLLRKKLKDICCIFREYEKAIEGRYTDSEDYIDTIVSRIPEARFVAGRTIWIYGFDCFTPKNFDMIGELIRNAGDVNIVMTYDEGGNDAQIFEITGAVIAQLEKLVFDMGADLSVKAIEGYHKNRSVAIEHLERQLYSLPAEPVEDCGGITLVHAAGVYQEAETAALYIMELVRDKGLKYRDIAVICNSMDKTAPVITRVFERYDIPVFIDVKRKIVSSAAVIFILTVMEIIVSGYESSRIFRVLKSGFTDFTEDEIEELENYSLKYRITGSGWKKEFAKGHKEYSEEELAALNDIRSRIIQMLSGFDESLKKAHTAGEKIKALYSFLTEVCHMPERIEEAALRQAEAGFIEEAQESAQIWNIAAGLMEQLSELIGDEKYSTKDIERLLKAGFEDMETGVLPPVCDGISAGTAQRSRLGDIKALVIIGADEGVFPKGASDEGLLSDDELELLESKDIHIGRLGRVKTQEETLGIYRSLAAPSEYLWIGTSSTDSGGQQQKPSPIIATLKRIFPSLTEELDAVSKGEAAELVAGAEASVPHMADALREALDGEPVADVWKQALGWYRENDRETLDRLEEGLFFTVRDYKLEQEKALKLYKKDGRDLSLSPSRLEKYCRCPFAHFVDYGLRPKERRIFEMAGREIGDVYHEVLMKLSEKLTTDGTDITDEKSLWMTITYEEYQALVKEILAEDIAGYGDGILAHTGEEEYRTARLSEIVEYIGWVLISHVRAGSIKEAAFEAPFRRGGSIPPIEIDAGDEKVYIEGIIDRIDILPDGSVKVIDYKSGSEKFSVKEAKAGWKLQLMLYLKAGLEYGRQHRQPAGVFYFLIENPMIDMSKESREDIGSSLESKIVNSFRLEGAIVNDPVVIESIAGKFDGRSSIVQLKTSPKGISGSGNDRLFERDEFMELLNDITDRVKETCEGIVSGDIKVAPKQKDINMSACTYCKYKNICSFDIAFAGCKYEMI